MDADEACEADRISAGGETEAEVGVANEDVWIGVVSVDNRTGDAFSPTCEVQVRAVSWGE